MKIYINLSLISFFLIIIAHLALANENDFKTNSIINKTREIAQNIRCLVCQNQSIDESNSELAKDLKKLIKEKLEAGLNENDVYKFLSDRYGDYILLKPPLNKNTILLWFLPFIILVLSTVYITKFFKK